MTAKRSLAASLKGWIARHGLRVALVLVAVLIAMAGVEHLMEARDFEQLTKGESFVEVGGARIRYRWVGQRQGAPVVVFLNGLLGSVEQWTELQPLISGFSSSLAYDQSGCGFSRGSSAFDAAEQANELLGVLTALHVRDRVVLVSYSSSTSVARMFGAKYPERVAGIVFLEPHFMDPTTGSNTRYLYRALARNIVANTTKTLFGLRRLKLWLGGSKADPRAPDAVREELMLVGFPHWWSTTLQWLVFWQNQREVFESPLPPSLPVMVLTSESWPEESRQGDGVKNFMARMKNASLVSLGSVRHDELLHREDSRGHLVDAIRTLAVGQRN